MTRPDDGIAVGRVVAERYRLERKLGSGGMSSVWVATDLTLGSPVAVKFIDPELGVHAEVRGRFYAEARAAAALRSPHVVQTLDYGVDQDLPFIAMELLEGETLATRLDRLGAIPPEETARIFADVGRAVRKAHEAGIVHRDLKPDNVFLVRNDDQEIAKVLDFGIAKTAEGQGAQRGATRTGVLLGTLPYMSPEQAQGKAVDFRSDLWALGVIAFECLTGKRPFDSDSGGELVLQICANPIPVPSQVGSVPPGFDAWFARAMTRDIDGRFQSVKELVDSLRAVLVPGASARLTIPDATTSSPGPMSAAPAATAPGTIVTMGGAAIDHRQGGARSRLIVPIAAAAAVALASIAWLATRPSAPVVSTAAPDAASAVPAPSVTVAPQPVAASAAPTVAPSAPPTATAEADTSASSPPPNPEPPKPAAKRDSTPRAKEQAPNPPPAKPAPPPSGKRNKDARIGF